jgi:putative phosphonate metabolism protein
MRYAIYFTPEHDDPLCRIAAGWLGRDAFGGAVTPAKAFGALSAAEVAFHTAAARRYGFHATLKAPFRLADGMTEHALIDAIDDFANATIPFDIPRLKLAQIDGFFALVPAEPLPELDRFAGDVVTAFEPYRAPLSDAEMARRNPDALSPRECRNLSQWGYPYVFDTFRFHMTLTGRIAAEEASRVRAAIEECLGETLDKPVPVDGLALFVEPSPGAPFEVRTYRALGKQAERKTA